MAGRIKIPPYKPLDVRTSAVLGGGYIHVDANAGSFGPSPLSCPSMSDATTKPR